MSARSAAPTGDPVQTLHYCMRQVVTLGASDLHFKSGSPPYVRLNGELVPIPGMYAVGEDELDAIVRELARSAPNRMNEFELAGETDLSYELASCARFRVNIFRQRGEVSIALRVVPDEVPTLESLNLPPVLEQLAMVPRGLVLVTGATGSGKSTSLAGMIDVINENCAKHIVTVEDPIEMVHRDKRSLINQREVGSDTGSFASALRRALRQDPDVILIGEMRDEETVRAALSAAETGHLVLSTLHTIDVMETIYRVLDFFPAELERQARSMLAGTLKGIVSQRLVRTADGRSRVPTVEVLVGTKRIADCILDPDQTGTIHASVAEGAYYGMQTFDQSLLQLVTDGAVAVDEAMYHSSSKQNFALLLEANNIEIGSDTRRRAAGSASGSDEDGQQRQIRRATPPPPPPTSLDVASPPADPAQAPAHPAQAPLAGQPGQAAAHPAQQPAAHHPAAAQQPAQAAGEVLPSIAGGVPSFPFAPHPGFEAQQASFPVDAASAAPQQPRPQPGIEPGADPGADPGYGTA